MSGLDIHGNPVCEPLDGLGDVINWSADKFRFHEHPTGWTYDIAEDNTVSQECGKRPQVLVCHDMEGGYLEDRFAQGSNDSTAYRFYHWHLIDTFIYFSHQFITIPPIGWISAAHRNSVQILGTIITEWEDGANICKELLASKETIDLVAAKLAEIAFIFGFDGWLVNIENVISEESIPDLQYFVQQLTKQCHSSLRCAKVLWYDSVTRAGDLLWQNELNDENEMFFSVCDGIFLNYAITEATLQNTLKKSQAVNRCFDVYVGVDVFGRATPGGGGFNCRQILEMISKYRLSCALFAQAWTYEKHGAKLFDANEIKFWGLLKDVLPLRAVHVPFSTSFCQGFGQRHHLKGKVISAKPWHNLLLQQIQPCCYGNCNVSLTTSDAYIGGGCLKLAAKTADEGLPMIRLFKIAVDQKEPLILSAVWKGYQSGDADCGLAFVFQPTNESTVVSERQMVLTNEKYGKVDEKIWKQCLLGGDSDSPVGSWKGSVQFIDASNSGGTDTCDWITSQWVVDMDCLLNDRNSRHRVDLFVVVLCYRSSDTVNIPTTQIEKSVLLGNVQMQWRKNWSQNSLMQPNLNSLICLQVNTVEPISKQNVSTAASTLEDLRRVAKCEFDNLPAPTRHCSLNLNDPALKWPCIFKCFTVASLCDESLACSLHVLNWTICDIDAERVDYCLLFSLDEKGSEHFIGCSCANIFICRLDKGLKVVAYFIQPVMKYTGLPGQKVFFQLQ